MHCRKITEVIAELIYNLFCDTNITLVRPNNKLIVYLIV